MAYTQNTMPTAQDVIARGRAYLASQAAAAARAKYGNAAGAAVDFLLSPSSSAPAPSAARVVGPTRLASYLDKRYERKCGVEVKQNQVAAASTAVTTTLASYLNPYMGIAQGLTDVTRSGSSIEVKSLQLNLNFFAGAGSTTATMVRLIVVKQSIMQNAALAAAVILESPGSIQSPYALDKSRSFTVIKDKTFVLGGLTQGLPSAIKQIKWTYRPKRCHQIKWTQADSTGVIGNAIEGNIGVFLMYQGATAPSFDYYFRANYIDV